MEFGCCRTVGRFCCCCCVFFPSSFDSFGISIFISISVMIGLICKCVHEMYEVRKHCLTTNSISIYMPNSVRFSDSIRKVFCIQNADAIHSVGHFPLSCRAFIRHSHFNSFFFANCVDVFDVISIRYLIDDIRDYIPEVLLNICSYE